MKTVIKAVVQSSWSAHVLRAVLEQPAQREAMHLQGAKPARHSARFRGMHGNDYTSQNGRDILKLSDGEDLGKSFST